MSYNTKPKMGTGARYIGSVMDPEEAVTEIAVLLSNESNAPDLVDRIKDVIRQTGCHINDYGDKT